MNAHRPLSRLLLLGAGPRLAGATGPAFTYLDMMRHNTVTLTLALGG